MKKFEVKENYTVDDVAPLMARLRDKENGCPWDKVQTHESIRQNFLEEAYEAVDAIDKKDKSLLKEELGDVLLQVALHCEMEREDGVFDIDDVANGLCQKLVYRHPHVFSSVTAETSEKVLANWEDLKRAEKSQKSGSDAIEDVAKALPALVRSQKVQKRAAHVGFDYPDIDGALCDLDSELDELKRALSGDGDVEEELGDLIFSAVNVARFAKKDAERALEKACEKFVARFKKVEQKAKEKNIDLRKADIDILNELWYNAKG